MTPENEWPVYRVIPRIDSFEVTEGDCTAFLTDEQKSWPVGPVQPRIDSFEVIEDEPTAPAVAAIRVTVAGTAAPADMAVVVERLRAAVEEAQAATGGRVPITIDVPTA